MSDPPDPISRLNAALEGRYAIERKIGEGGMATVYLAEDLRHERKVALKVLKSELAAVVGAERFLAEIKTTANLQHPHILPLFDSGQAESFLYYVMPYVEGDTLRDKIDREKQLSVDEALEISKKVASALDYADEHGIVHRDIKPGNILLSERGEPTVADFGIALAVAQAGGGRVTETGLSLGTPHYMSPEQATGDRDVDPRADVYALGCVLYEMLTGEPPYQGATAQAVLAKILTDPAPAPAQARVSIPPNVDAAIRTALEKLPADRFKTAQDFARALSDPTFRRGDEASADSSIGLWNPLSISMTATTLILLLVVGLSWIGRSPAAAPLEPVSRLTLSLDGDHRLAQAEVESFPLAISPDGRILAYAGESTSGTQLYVRSLDAYDPTPLSGTDEARQPFFSPDGQWIAYFARSGLFRVPTSGGAPIRVAQLPPRPDTEISILPTGGAWGPDNLIVFASSSALWRVRVEGGEPEELPISFPEAEGDSAVGQPEDTVPSGETTELRVGWPSFLPTGDSGDPLVLVSLSGELSTVSPVDGSARGLGVQSTGHGLYVPTGHILYTQTTGEARAVTFDLDALEVTGTAVPVLENVFRANQTPATMLAISASGTLVYVPGGSQRTLALVDRDGRERLLPFEPRPYRFPGLSPDGTQLAVNARGLGLLLLDLESGAERLIGGDQVVAWHPDGEELAAGSPPHRVRVAPGSVPEPIAEAGDSTYAMNWGRDDRLLLFNPWPHRETQAGIYIASIGSGVPAEAVIDTPYDERDPKRSPDGRWLAYSSDATGRREVYVRELDVEGDPEPVSINGGSNPIWSRSGDEVFFWKGEQVFSARLTATDPLEISDPELLLTGRYFIEGGFAWDASPSGEFLLISAGPNWLREIRVVQNFIEELRQVVPD